jgi:hypothetical protein
MLTLNRLKTGQQHQMNIFCTLILGYFVLFMHWEPWLLLLLIFVSTHFLTSRMERSEASYVNRRVLAALYECRRSFGFLTLLIFHIDIGMRYCN